MSAMAVAWMVWSIFAALGFFGFALRIAAPVQPHHGSMFDYVAFVVCGSTLAADGLVAAFLGIRAAYGGDNMQHIVKTQDW